MVTRDVASVVSARERAREMQIRQGWCTSTKGAELGEPCTLQTDLVHPCWDGLVLPDRQPRATQHRHHHQVGLAAVLAGNFKKEHCPRGQLGVWE